uniref:Uncharacterized protein n=1 Tax=Anguilla anguilla TaxID=7936 RepID=A0A0E9U587_ANGAN
MTPTNASRELQDK